MPMTRLIIFLVALTIYWLGCVSVAALRCQPNRYLYGENEIVDQLLTCSLSRTFDLDLTPEGGRVRSTSKPLVETGLSNKTTVLHAKLSGLWTARRPRFIESGWRCDENITAGTSIIELDSLSLVMVERLDTQSHRNQHRLAAHQPCKTFDLPVWMCRRSKPIYRTTTTWVNRAYFNLTLSQRLGETRPSIDKLSPMFTCPETFKQKITYSPSSAYILARHLHQTSTQPAEESGAQTQRSHSDPGSHSSSEPLSPVATTSHPSSFSTVQTGETLVTPPYHNSVSLIMDRANEILLLSLNDCINLTDSDLSLTSDHNSFSENKYNQPDESSSSKRASKKHKQSLDEQMEESSANLKNECSNQDWIRTRVELAVEANALDYGSIGGVQLSSRPGMRPGGGLGDTGHHKKRDQLLFRSYPSDPNQLLNPYGFYHADQMVMIDDDY